MARTDHTTDVDDGPVLAQNLEYTRIISRKLMPDLERRFQDQTDPPVGTWTTKRPRGDFVKADEQENSIRLEDLSHGVTEDSDKWTMALKPTISQGHLSKDSGGGDRVSIDLESFWGLIVTDLTSYRYTRD